MDPTMEEKIKETVLEILRNSDMQEMTEFKVRKLASDQLGLDLSSDSTLKKFVRQVVESFLLQQQQQNDAVVEAEHDDDDDDAVKDDEIVEEDDEDERRPDAKEYDDNGDLVICHLSTKRRVTIQNFRGKTLVSIREYYEKGGKSLPTSKGISLTAEQWAAFKKNVPAIEKALQKIEGRLD